MPPYIYIPTNVFTIKSEQKNKNQRKCSFCLCFFNKYYVFCGIKYSIGKYQCVFPLAFNNKKKKNSVLVLDKEHISDVFDGKFIQER